MTEHPNLVISLIFRVIQIFFLNIFVKKPFLKSKTYGKNFLRCTYHEFQRFNFDIFKRIKKKTKLARLLKISQSGCNSFWQLLFWYNFFEWMKLFHVFVARIRSILAIFTRWNFPIKIIFLEIVFHNNLLCSYHKKV